MRDLVASLLICAAVCAPATATAAGQAGLALVHAARGAPCGKAAALLGETVRCEAARDASCPDRGAARDLGQDSRLEGFTELASNEYGYTQLARGTAPGPGDGVLLYVDRFQGDRQHRLSQLYLVDARRLDEVLSLEPGPIPLQRRLDEHLEVDQEANAAPMADLLARGRKVADDWPLVLRMAGRSYLVEFDCDGGWAAGDFTCTRVRGVRLMEVFGHRQPELACAFGRAPGRSR